MSRHLTAKQQRWIKRFAQGEILLILARQAHQALPLLPDGARHTDQGIALVACEAGLVILVAGDVKKMAWAVTEISDHIARAPDHILLVCSVRCLQDLPDLGALLSDIPEAAASLLLSEGHSLPGWEDCLPYLPGLALIGGAVSDGKIANPLSAAMAALRTNLLSALSEKHYPAILQLSQALESLAKKLSALSGLRSIGEIRLGGNGQPLPALWGNLAKYRSVKATRDARGTLRRAVVAGVLAAILGFGGLATMAGAALLPVVQNIMTLRQTQPGTPERFDRLIGLLRDFSEPQGQLWLKWRLLDEAALKILTRNGLLPELVALQDRQWRNLDRQVTDLDAAFSADQIDELLDRITRAYTQDVALRRWSSGAGNIQQIAAAFKELTGSPWLGAAVEVHHMTPAAIVPPPPIDVAVWRDHLGRVLAERHRRNVQNGSARRLMLQIKASLQTLDRPWAALDLGEIAASLQDLTQKARQIRPDPLLEAILRRIETIPLLGGDMAVSIRRQHAVWSSALIRDRASVSWGGLTVFKNDAASEVFLTTLRQSGERITALRAESRRAVSPEGLLAQLKTLSEQAEIPSLPAPWQTALSQAARQIWSERVDAWLADLDDVEALWQSAALGALRTEFSSTQQARLDARLTPLLRARFNALEQSWREAAVYQPDQDFVGQWDGQTPAAFAIWGLEDQDFVGLRYRLFYDRQSAGQILTDAASPFITRLQASGLQGFEAEKTRWQSSLQAWEAFTGARGAGAIGALDSYVVEGLSTVTAARCAVSTPSAPDGADVFSKAAQGLERAVAAGCARLNGG